MKKESIPSKIIDILTKESRLTINEIFDKSEIAIERKEYLRCCVNRLSKAEKIAKDGKNGKEYLYSLINNIKELEDTLILKKMIPEFINYGVNLKTTTDKEDKRILELIEDTN